mmetsp:Transcript_118360/g.334465  ORF Transcript_118360/g.334465 Transcript_118360/m.334465 type:complete len:219 (+) Transcript_118360:740-1396(+)
MDLTAPFRKLHLQLRHGALLGLWRFLHCEVHCTIQGDPCLGHVDVRILLEPNAHGAVVDGVRPACSRPLQRRGDRERASRSTGTRVAHWVFILYLVAGFRAQPRQRRWRSTCCAATDIRRELRPVEICRASDRQRRSRRGRRHDRREHCGRPVSHSALPNSIADDDASMWHCHIGNGTVDLAIVLRIPSHPVRLRRASAHNAGVSLLVIRKHRPHPLQ